MEAGLGIKLESDSEGFLVIVGFENAYVSTKEASVNLEIGWRILSVDSQHTEGVPVAEVDKWLQGPLGSLVLVFVKMMIC